MVTVGMVLLISILFLSVYNTVFRAYKPAFSADDPVSSTGDRGSSSDDPTSSADVPAVRLYSAYNTASRADDAYTRT